MEPVAGSGDNADIWWQGGAVPTYSHTYFCVFKRPILGTQKVEAHNKDNLSEQQNRENLPVGFIVCKQCGQQQPEFREKCVRCDAPLHAVSPEEEKRLEQPGSDNLPDGFIVCKQCGRQQPANRETCYRCNAPLHAAVSVPTPSDPQPLPEQQGTKFRVCAQCGNYNPENAVYCLKCGGSLAV